MAPSKGLSVPTPLAMRLCSSSHQKGSLSLPNASGLGLHFALADKMQQKSRYASSEPGIKTLSFHGSVYLLKPQKWLGLACCKREDHVEGGPSVPGETILDQTQPANASNMWESLAKPGKLTPSHVNGSSCTRKNHSTAHSRIPVKGFLFPATKCWGSLSCGNS